MNLNEILEHMNNGKPIEGNSELHAFMVGYTREAMQLTCQLNSSYHEPEEIRALFSKIIGKPVDESFRMFPPFTTDFGKNITVGKDVFINSGCRFQDQGGITIGDNTLIGHNVVLATLNHGIALEKRHINYPKPIIIGNNVWIGSNATILQGVSIGDNAIVAAGAVVNKNVPEAVIVGGVPATVLKTIEEAAQGPA